MKSWPKPTDDLVQTALESVRTVSDRMYFFPRLKNPHWIEPLAERGFFDHPPKVKHLPDGYIQYPVWPEFQYLKNVAQKAPEQVIEVILRIPATNNSRFYEDVVDIALKVDAGHSTKLKARILEYADGKYPIFLPRFEKILCHWSRNDEVESALALTRALIQFQPDLESQEKQTRRRANTEQPRPRFSEWEYERILDKGVRSVSEKAPYQTARILIDATATMIRLGFHQDELEEVGSNDHSTVWCHRVNGPSERHWDSKEKLVHALTFACERVLENAPESVSALDQELRKQHWEVFMRIRQHLYALYPNEQTKPWIRELILAHRDYGKWEYQFEFQRMIYLACENFGASLLTTTEMKQIYEAILNGPSEHAFREWMGDRFSEEAFNQRKRYFHRMQLRPFERILFGKYVGFYQELTLDEEKPVTDDDYAPYKSEGARGIVKIGPKSAEQLAKMSDEEILLFLNEWENTHRDPEKWWVEINFEGLSREFQATFKEQILPDEVRLRFWFKNREQIKRPIYVRAMVSAMHERVTAKQFDVLDKCLVLCDWVLSHSEHSNEMDDNFTSNFREPPGWQSTRRAVGDFVGACLEKNINVPVSASEGLFALLDRLCTQYDKQLDDNEPDLLNRDDQLTEAINNTRSRALEDLVDFGYWLRRQSQDDQADTPEVFTILEKRLGPGCERVLTLPEYALLGLNFGRICGLNLEWATQHKSDLFPQETFTKWREAFGNFLKYNPRSRLAFDIMQDDIKFALENIGNFQTGSDGTTNLADTLGEHLFTYYLWDVFPLTGEESLLERFYDKTQDDKDRWSQLFDFVGRSLKNSGKQLKEALKQRIIEFFKWRLDKREAAELREFTFWLEAECLDAEWRLRSFSKTLDVSGSVDIGLYIQVKALRRMLEENIALVVECFAKLVDRTVENDSANYIETDKARPILQAGLESDDATVRKNAERAREKLLQRGHFDLLDVEN